jgi:hypothetical protein
MTRLKRFDAALAIGRRKKADVRCNSIRLQPK